MKSDGSTGLKDDEAESEDGCEKRFGWKGSRDGGIDKKKGKHWTWSLL